MFECCLLLDQSTRFRSNFLKGRRPRVKCKTVFISCVTIVIGVLRTRDRGRIPFLVLLDWPRVGLSSGNKIWSEFSFRQYPNRESIQGWEKMQHWSHVTSVSETHFESGINAFPFIVRIPCVPFRLFSSRLLLESAPALFFIIPRAHNLINVGRCPCFCIPLTKCHLIGNWWLYTRKNVRLNDWHNLLLIRIDPISNNVPLLDHSSLRSPSISLSPLFGQLDPTAASRLQLDALAGVYVQKFLVKASSDDFCPLRFGHMPCFCRTATKISANHGSLN